VSTRIIVILAAGAAVLAAAAIAFVALRPDPPAPGVAVEAPVAAPEPTPPARPDPARPGSPVAPPRPRETAPPVEAAPTTGTLRIESDVPGTSVFIDRKFLGTTPLTVPGLAPGTYALVLSPEGFESHAATVEVRAGEQDYRHRFKILRLDERVDVVHKHGMGSCRGTLIATPQGLRYRTDHESDGFMVPLTDLEVFSVDYLKNNLQVKVRGGRTYNFEDPDGNADRIFVFHREVQEAITRMRDWRFQISDGIEDGGLGMAIGSLRIAD
jgi:hypothetical protein